ncbi:MAG: hypothetical protein MPJ79_00485 [Alphaproteobacteria bacterium]|nr:hypothetical protein [Alphaproteobacteria bacterium]MDA7982597.1 hypothetical protein [Alphaproteobacteria bacterium]MDA7988364.1 hypothetical protein [Alphaproteobacteria bacterium]MDA8008774.1 hypothetical protein [Alphaproteobacteria bacterium]
MTKKTTSIRRAAVAALLGAVAATTTTAARAHHFYDVWLEAEGSLLFAMRRALSEPSHFGGLVALLGVVTALVLFFARRTEDTRIRRASQVFVVVMILTVAFSGFVAFAP